MSIQAMSAVLGLQPGVVSTNDRFVLLSIANHANREGEQANPSRDTICLETGLSLSTVTRCTQRLRKKGLLEVLDWPGRDRDGKFTGTIVYAVRIPGLKKAPIASQPSPPLDLGSGPQADTRTGKQADTRTGKQADTRTGSQTGSQTGGHGDTGTVEPWNREYDPPLARRCPKCRRPLTVEDDDGVRTLACVYCQTEGDQMALEVSR